MLLALHRGHLYPMGERGGALFLRKMSEKELQYKLALSFSHPGQ